MDNFYRFKVLLLGMFLLSGCRVQTLYLNPEAQGVVVDALNAVPVANAEVKACGAAAVTRQDGSFHIEERTDWEVVVFLAGRSPLDSKRPCYMSIVADGYQPRYWQAPVDVRYDFPVRLLPAGSHSRYKDGARDGESYPGLPVQAEPRRDETFVPAADVAR